MEQQAFNQPEEEKKVKAMMVKMDHRNSYIQWLLDWDKKPRRSLRLRHWPEELRVAREAFEAEDAHHERVLAQYKSCGYAYVQVDVFDDDDPEANLPDDQYDDVDEVDLEDEAEHITHLSRF
jgi:hypothetical protein